MYSVDSQVERPLSPEQLASHLRFCFARYYQPSTCVLRPSTSVVPNEHPWRFSFSAYLIYTSPTSEPCTARPSPLLSMTHSHLDHRITSQASPRLATRRGSQSLARAVRRSSVVPQLRFRTTKPRLQQGNTCTREPTPCTGLRLASSRTASDANQVAPTSGSSHSSARVRPCGRIQFSCSSAYPFAFRSATSTLSV